MEEEENRFTEGSIIKSIILLTTPIIIGNLLQSAYQITDAFWVGRLGKDAVASIALSFPIMFFIIALSGGIGLGGAVFVSQYKGKKDKEMVDKITSQAFLITFFISILFSIIGYILTPEIARAFGADKAVFQGAVNYLRISFLGLFFVFGYLIFQSLMRGVGNAKTPVYIILVTVLLNFALDPLFIFGWKFIPALGVAGAAMATIMTQGIALFIGAIILIRGKSGIQLKFSYLKADWKLIKKIIFLGIPISLEQSSRSIGFILMTALVSGFGTITLASYGIGTQMMGLVIVVALSLSIANSSLVGQNIGAGKIDRAEKIARTSAILGFIALTIIGILFFIFAKDIISAFIPNDLEVIASGALLLKVIALTFGVIGVQMALFGTLRGSGNTKTTMKIAILVVVIQLASAFVLSKYTSLGEFGLWLGFPISNIVGFIVTVLIFAKGDWKNKKILESPEVSKNIKEELIEDENRVSV